MKPKYRPLFPVVTSLAALLIPAMPLHAATQIWTSGASGDFNDGSKYSGLAAPAASGDSVTANGAFAINYLTGYNFTLADLILNGTSGGGTFNQTGGNLEIGTLYLGRTSGDAGGASRIPTYSLSGGTVGAASIQWGNGANTPGIRINQTAGTFNFTGTSMSMGGTASGNSHINVSGGEFNANSATTLYLGNGGTGKGTISMSGSGAFSATSATLVLGQSGSSGSLGTVNMAGTSTLAASTIVLGGNNATFATNGVINLNGGTITAGSIRKGNSSIAASSTANVLHANGGTVKVSSHANNSNYFLGTFVDLQAGGLKFDTNGNNAGISNAMSGTGGLTKKGSGTLALSGTNTYSGLTTVETGTLVNNGTIAGDVTVDSGATLAGGGIISGNTTVNGTLAIGNSPESMDFGGNLTLTGTSIFELGGSATAGTDYDFANATGTLTLGGVLNIVSYNSYDLSLNAAYNLFDAGSITGTFTSVSVGALNLAYDLGSDTWSAVSGPQTYTFNETNGVLTVVPEPAAAMLGLIGTLLLLRRRR